MGEGRGVGRSGARPARSRRVHRRVRPLGVLRAAPVGVGRVRVRSSSFSSHKHISFLEEP
ncbi:hypothetical protein GZL_06244 [Streptomyces sp. 769]|nr:hypothetical protein GZL_06244 [Streptomyces sp. 769]